MRNMRNGIIAIIVIAAVGIGVKLLWPKMNPSSSNAQPAETTTAPTSQPTTRRVIGPPPPAGSISITPTPPRQAPSK